MDNNKPNVVAQKTNVNVMVVKRFPILNKANKINGIFVTNQIPQNSPWYTSLLTDSLKP